MYTKSHKIFLQAIMEEGVLHDQDSKELVIRLFDNDNVVTVVNEINKHLQTLNMLIKNVICEIVGDTYWALTSTTLQDANAFQTEFSKDQLRLLRKIFSEIIISGGCISSTTCLNFCTSLETKLLKIDANEFLDNVVKRKWLILKNGQYYMGVRSIAELMPYFKATYEDSLHTCSICKEIIFFGKKCTHCETIMHLACLKKYAKITHSCRCATCKNHIEMDDDIMNESLNTSKDR